MALVTKGRFSTTAPVLKTDGEYGFLQLDASGNLKVVETPAALASETVVAGADSTLGKIGVVPSGSTIYVACNASGGNYSKAGWRVKSDKAHTIQFGRARSNILSATLTLADATPVDDGDTCIINGLTFTAESTEAEALAAQRKYWTGADNAAAAANLAALLTNPTYGVPGIASATVAAVAATDVITITSGTNTALQFAQGTSDANELAWADTSLASIIMDEGSTRSSVAANSTTAGDYYDQYADGFPWLFMKYTQSSGSDATVVVGVTLY